MAKITTKRAQIIAEFIEDLGLVPKRLITKEVLELIHKSWEREFQQEYLNKAERHAMQDYIRKLSERAKRRKPRKVLDNMQPINVNPLFDNL